MGDADVNDGDVAHFYHCYCAGDWQRPLSEHLFVLDQTGWEGPLTVGLIGSATERELPRRIIRAVHPQATFVEADSGHEQVTIRAAHAWSKDHDGLVLYAHTKGAAHPYDLQTQWRHSMTHNVIARWRDLMPVLAGPWVDVIGCHWLIPELWTHHPDWQTPFFAGNFWYARCDYLRSLPPVADTDRGDAERWIGLGRPSVVDLLPGRPGHDNCLQLPMSVGTLIVEVDGQLQPQLD